MPTRRRSCAASRTASRCAASTKRTRTHGTVTDENWTLFNKYDYFFSKQWYYGGVLFFEHDKFADLNLRTSCGSAYRLPVLRKYGNEPQP